MADLIRWYMDEHAPRAVAQGLRRRGVDVQTTQEAGMLHAPDDLQLNFATRQGRAVFTQLVRGLMSITEIYDAEEIVGRVEFV